MKKELKIFDNPANVKRLLIFFYVVLALLIIIDVLFVDHGGHGDDEHGLFPWEEVPAFFAVYGFVSYVTLIFVAKGLRLLVMRSEKYYD
ncbi:MAG: hypothetical protein ACYTG7_02985 [Planctomycetota bacterium]|jgi:hypothetical protein